MSDLEEFLVLLLNDEVFEASCEKEFKQIFEDNEITTEDFPTIVMVILKIIKQLSLTDFDEKDEIETIKEFIIKFLIKSKWVVVVTPKMQRAIDASLRFLLMESSLFFRKKNVIVKWLKKCCLPF
jgi:hypothetical protein